MSDEEIEYLAYVFVLSMLELPWTRFKVYSEVTGADAVVLKARVESLLVPAIEAVEGERRVG